MFRALCLCAFLVVPLWAGEWKSKGEVTAEGRIFTDDDDPVTTDGGYGAFSRVELSYRDGPFRVKIRGFGRVDQEDDSRDLAVIQEAWLGYRKKGWEIRAGFDMFNWTATEAFHPADLVNSRNLDSRIENPDKIGELTFSVKRRIRDGALTLYYWPRYEEPILPEASSRLNLLPFEIGIGDTLWLEDDNELTDNSTGVQYGARFSQTIGDADVSVHYLNHLDRTPAAGLLDADFEFRPVFQRVQDIGLTYLHILGSWILKIEANARDYEDQTGIYALFELPDHEQGAFGLEYSWAAQSGSETSIIFEGQGFFGITEEQRAVLNPFQRDLLLGMRHAWNDAKSRELLITTIYDVERSHEYLFNINYKQRLTDVWSIETGIRAVDAPIKDEDNPVGLELLDESNQIFLNVSRFF